MWIHVFLRIRITRRIHGLDVCITKRERGEEVEGEEESRKERRSERKERGRTKFDV